MATMKFETEQLARDRDNAILVSSLWSQFSYCDSMLSKQTSFVFIEL